jgi:hypothetical protein
MAPTCRIATVLAALGVLLAVAPGASAAPPTCWNAAVWARPGMARTVELYCPRTEHAVLAVAPHASRAELVGQGERMQLRLEPELGAPEHDTLTLHLSGGTGDADQDVSITNVPLSENTAPRCDPVSESERTTGTEPVAIKFHVACRDAEHDDVTLHGSGPGTHVDSPLTIAGGTATSSPPFWRYRPTIAAGTEQASYYAVDALGARSADAPIVVMVGPGVDRLPECRPNPGGSGQTAQPVYTRPGAPRRFALICEDADGDAISPRLVQPPARGDIVRFEAQPPASGYWGTEVWVDAVYVPRGAFEGVDELVVAGAGPRGVGPGQAIAMTARALPENDGLGCALWNPPGTGGDPVTLHAECEDRDGDPVQASIASPPAHGRLSPPVPAVGRYGAVTLDATYRPEPGFSGIDYVTIAATDGSATTTELDFSIRVGGPSGFGYMSLEDLARFMGNAVSAPAPTPVEQARQALGTGAVRFVKNVGEARVYAPRRTVRAASRAGVLALTCLVRCTLSSRSTVAGRTARTARRGVSPETAATLALTPAQRRRAQRAGGARAVFRLEVARTGRAARRATVGVAVAR